MGTSARITCAMAILRKLMLAAERFLRLADISTAMNAADCHLDSQCVLTGVGRFRQCYLVLSVLEAGHCRVKLILASSQRAKIELTSVVAIGVFHGGSV